jgi:hypothetical protein
VPEPRAGIQSNKYLRKILRQGWRTHHVADNNPTASIIRASTTTNAGKPSAGVSPTISAVSSTLANLAVAVSYPGNYDAEYRPPDFVPLRENERIFSFLDIPTAGGVAAGTIQLSDYISFEGRTWKPTKVENDLQVGLSHARCELYGR